MRRVRRAAVCLLAACSLGIAMPPAQAAPLVERVTAQVEASDTIPPRVQARMASTVTAIAEQLLAGMRVSDASAQAAANAAVIREVFDKVLVGYTVSRVDILPGEETAVRVVLIPWDDVIRDVRVETAVEGMPPTVEAMVREDLAAVDTVFRESLVGLPIAASD